MSTSARLVEVEQVLKTFGVCASLLLLDETSEDAEATVKLEDDNLAIENVIKSENIKVETHFDDFHTGTCENPGKMNEACEDSKSVKDEPDPLEMLEENSENHFTCPECDKIFKRGQLMEIHIRRMHIGDLNFLCEMCPKRFHSRREKNISSKYFYRLRPGFFESFSEF